MSQYRTSLVVFFVVLFLVVLATFFWREIGGNRSMNFHGRVLDQDGRPITGVEIDAEFSYGKTLFIPYLFAPGTDLSESLQAVTDQNGNFAFHRSGLSFEIKRVSKDGYLGPAECRHPFQAYYEFVQIDPNKVYTLVMWHSGPTESLVEKKFKAAEDANHVDFYIDLLTGKRVSPTSPADLTSQ